MLFYFSKYTIVKIIKINLIGYIYAIVIFVSNQTAHQRRHSFTKNKQKYNYILTHFH